MGSTSRRPRSIRSLALMGWAFVSQLALGSGAASADEVQRSEETARVAAQPAAAPARRPDVVAGLSAVALMHQERRQHHSLPRMLPLLAARAERGQLWLGLANGRSAAAGAANVRLELCWVVPIGQ
jgi:hypothetical protein